MAPNGTGTFFLEAERDPPELVEVQRRHIIHFQGLALFEEFPIPIMVFNRRRQIVFINQRGRNLLSDPQKSPYGQRLGEAFGCIHANDGGGGCGTGRFCRYCGAARSLAGALAGALNTQACKIDRTLETKSEQLDLLVWTKPLDLEGQPFILTALVDVSAEERRQLFERIFLHDVMNTAASLMSLLRLMNDRDPDFTEYLNLAQVSAEQLVEEIAGQRALLEAEKGTLQLESQPVVIRDLLSSVVKTYQGLAQTRGIELSLSVEASPVAMTDPTLLKRVVSNLVKNAIEASKEGETVRLQLREDPRGVDIRVWNSSVLSEEVYANLFKRSFSTKGAGRGLGTYGSRIFVEEYLGGALSCTSEAGTGTTFTVRIPPSLSPPQPL